MQYQICKKYAQTANKKDAIYVHNKPKYPKICSYMQKYQMQKYAKCTNMQNQICTNMHFQNMHKYAFYNQM